MRDDNVQILICRISTARGAFEHWLELLSEPEKRRYEGLQRAAARERFLTGRALLRLLLHSKYGIEPKAAIISADELGKPHLADFPHLHINLSHSHDLAVVCTGPAPIGVDVEYRQRHNDISMIARGYFSMAEQRDIQALGPDQARTRFFQYWTLKEAFAKASGLGLSRTLSHTHITRVQDGAALQLPPDTAPDQQVHFWHFPLFEQPDFADYQLGVVLLEQREAQATRPLG